MFRARNKKLKFRKKEIQEVEDSAEDFNVEFKSTAKKRTKAPAVTEKQESLKYDSEMLIELKNEQNKASFKVPASVEKPAPEIAIPDQEMIEKAKSSRLEKLKMLEEMEKNQENEFIGINGTVANRTNESRLVTDEQFDDETFEDYNGELAFGEHAVELLKDAAIKEREDLMNMEVDDDEEVVKWELETIKLGKRAKLDLVIQNRNEKKTTVSQLPIPDIPEIPSHEDILNRLENEVLILNQSVNTHKYNLEILVADEDSQEFTAKKINEEILIASKKYDFFKTLAEYVADLTSFLEAKDCIIDDFFDRVLLQRQNRKNNEIQHRLSILSKCSIFMSSNNPSIIENSDEMILDEVEIIAEKTTLFAEVSNKFNSIAAVKKVFEPWIYYHPKEYHDSFADEALIKGFAIYIKYELSDWNPFIAHQKLSEMEWYTELSNFGTSSKSGQDSILLSLAIEKIFIPIFKSHAMSSFNLWNATHSDRSFDILDELCNQFGLKSRQVQDILDNFEDLINQEVINVLKSFPKFQNQVDDIERVYTAQKEEFVNSIIDVFNINKFTRNVKKWKRFFPIGVVKRWVSDKLLNQLCKSIECSRNFESDLQFYCQITEIVKDYIPDVHNTPSDFKYLQVAILKNVLKPSEKMEMESKFYEKLLTAFDNIKSYEVCALIGNKLRKEQS